MLVALIRAPLHFVDNVILFCSILQFKASIVERRAVKILSVRTSLRLHTRLQRDFPAFNRFSDYVTAVGV